MSSADRRILNRHGTAFAVPLPSLGISSLDLDRPGDRSGPFLFLIFSAFSCSARTANRSGPWPAPRGSRSHQSNSRHTRLGPMNQADPSVAAAFLGGGAQSRPPRSAFILRPKALNRRSSPLQGKGTIPQHRAKIDLQKTHATYQFITTLAAPSQRLPKYLRTMERGNMLPKNMLLPPKDTQLRPRESCGFSLFLIFSLFFMALGEILDPRGRGA